jgi:hypothetical protein
MAPCALQGVGLAEGRKGVRCKPVATGSLVGKAERSYVLLIISNWPLRCHMDGWPACTQLLQQTRHRALSSSAPKSL